MTTDYQLLPALLPEDFEALKTSIAEQGVDVPIIVDQEGNTIDGYHRQRACDELGTFCPREVRQFENEADKLELILRLNCRRRHLNQKQRRFIIEAYLLRDPEIADNFLAENIGVSKNTVAEVRCEMEATCQIDKFKMLRGKDGKRRPVKYKKIVANTPEEAENALKLIGDLPDGCGGRTIDSETAARQVGLESSDWLQRKQDSEDRPKQAEERERHDFYPTPRGVTEALLQVAQFSETVWEPACGDGAISNVLTEAGYSVTSSDLIDRGYGKVEDFLANDRRANDIITNPPYSKAEEFVRKALSSTTGKVAMFLPLTFLESRKRESLLASSCLKTVYVFVDRVSLYKGGSTNCGGGRAAYAWFLWEHGFEGPPTLGWVHSERKGRILGPMDATCPTVDTLPDHYVGRLPVNRQQELTNELCLHIEEAHELGRLMDSNLLLSELSKWESVPLPTLRRLVKELPSEVRGLLNNDLPPAA